MEPPSTFDVERDAAGDPVRVGFAGRWQRVAEIVDRWWGEGHRYVSLRAEDGARYVVRHDDREGLWTLVLFEAPGAGTEGGRNGNGGDAGR